MFIVHQLHTVITSLFIATDNSLFLCVRLMNHTLMAHKSCSTFCYWLPLIIISFLKKRFPLKCTFCLMISRSTETNDWQSFRLFKSTGHEVQKYSTRFLSSTQTSVKRNILVNTYEDTSTAAHLFLKDVEMFNVL